MRVTIRPGRRLDVGVSAALESLIQAWVRLTGKAVWVDDVPWLDGPSGANVIGSRFYDSYAAGAGLDIAAGQPGQGLLDDFAGLRGEGFAPERVAPEIRDFYERTGDYDLDVWSEWTGILAPFAHGLIRFVSRHIEQFNLPLSPLDLSTGMSSEVIRLVDRRTGQVRYSGWLRRTASTGATVYAGFYTTCQPPRYPDPCVKVAFPLPRGGVTVILKPRNGAGGSFHLVSAGRAFGEPGYYRIHRVGSKELRVKYLPLKETFHVYLDAQKTLRTDHVLTFWSLTFLKLHYKITPKHEHASL